MFRPATGPRRCLAAAVLLAAATSAALVVDAAPTSAARPHDVVTAKPAPRTVSFNATGTGTIPDHDPGSSACGGDGTPGVLDLSFAVSGLTGQVTDVSVTVTLDHPDGGELALTLIAPTTLSQSVLHRPTATNATSCGSVNTVSGTYTFNDQATASFWTALAAGTPAPGAYRAGGTSYTDTPVGLSQAFLPLEDPNGAWVLRAQDFGWTGVGSVSSATLRLTVDDPTPCAAATARVSTARAALTGADARATAAAAALTKAKAGLKRAKRSGDPRAVKRARAKVRRAATAAAAAGAGLRAARAELAAASAAAVQVC